LEDVDILVYGLNLTKRGTLCFRTIEILKKFLPEETMLRWDFAEPSCRCCEGKSPLWTEGIPLAQ